ncbi:MAG: ankyrin repeat domain-containing protein [Shewanella sp.]|nr:ankyrin repeat domain-containing protein [Shewanella sp.]
MSLSSVPPTIGLFYHSHALIIIESDSKTLTALTKNHSQQKTVLIKFMNNSHTHEAEPYTLSCKPRADDDSFGWKLESHSTIVDFHLPNEKTVAISSLEERLNGITIFAFFNAVIKGDTHNIRAFLKDGVNLNLQSNSITFPKNKYYFSTRTRVKHYVFRQTVWGAPSRPIDQIQRDQTALHLAVIADHKNTVSLLIDKGAPIDIRNQYGNTPLVEAIVSKNDPIALLLIEKHCDVDMRTGNNLLPLRHSIVRKRYDVVDAIAKKSKYIGCGSFRSTKMMKRSLIINVMGLLFCTKGAIL